MGYLAQSLDLSYDSNSLAEWLSPNNSPIQHACQSTVSPCMDMLSHNNHFAVPWLQRSLGHAAGKDRIAADRWGTCFGLSGYILYGSSHITKPAWEIVQRRKHVDRSGWGRSMFAVSSPLVLFLLPALLILNLPLPMHPKPSLVYHWMLQLTYKLCALRLYKLHCSFKLSFRICWIVFLLFSYFVICNFCCCCYQWIIGLLECLIQSWFTRICRY